MTVGVPEKEIADVGTRVSVGGNVAVRGAVSIASVDTAMASCVRAPQAVKIMARNKGSIVLRRIFIFPLPLIFYNQTPNGWRYPLVGGTRQRHFDGTSLKPHKLPENAQTPTSRVHAVLGRGMD